MDAEQLRATISKMYSCLNYDQFCTYMEFNPKYDEKYWTMFRGLANAVADFDDTRLQKILDFDKAQGVK